MNDEIGNSAAIERQIAAADDRIGQQVCESCGLWEEEIGVVQRGRT